MGFLTGLFSGKKVRLDDPDFGTLEFERNLWTAVPPQSSFPCMVHVVAPESGPSTYQRDFACKLKAEFHRYEELGKAFVNGLRADTRKPIDIYSVEIGPDDEIRRGQFTMEYADDDAHIVYGAWFDGWMPTRYSEDD